MEIKVNFLDKLRLEAKFDDFTVVADQPIRYKGDGSAPGPFDYFLASSVLCAAYFVKLYCVTRNISTENIRLSQNNIVDPVVDSLVRLLAGNHFVVEGFSCHKLCLLQLRIWIPQPGQVGRSAWPM